MCCTDKSLEEATGTVRRIDRIDIYVSVEVGVPGTLLTSLSSA
jgi:hypothetical protein